MISLRLRVFPGSRRERQATRRHCVLGLWESCMRRELVLESARANKDYIQENMGLLEKAEDRSLNCVY